MKRISRIISLILVLTLVFTSFSFVTSNAATKKYAYVKFSQSVSVHSASDGTGKSYKKITKGKYKGRYKIPAGIHSFTINKNGYYKTVRAFYISKSSLGKKKSITVSLGKRAGNGFEANTTIYRLTSTIESKAFSTKNLKSYKKFDTPAFSASKGAHEFSSNAEVCAYSKEVCDSSSNLTYFDTDFAMPVVVFTNTDISGCNSYLDAAEVLSHSSKLNVYYQAQIHGNEPASGEGALTVIKDLSGSYGNDIADKVNIIIVPRLNYQGAKNYLRKFDKIDLNRDFINLDSKLSRFVVELFSVYKADVTLDAHECRDDQEIYLSKKGYAILNDIRISAASSNNIASDVSNTSYAIVDAMKRKCSKAGLKAREYKRTFDPSIGRSYFGLHNACSILIESRGLKVGKANYARRVFSQNVAVKSALTYCAQNGKQIKNSVTEARNHPNKLFAISQLEANTLPVKYTEKRYYPSGKIKSSTKTVYRGVKTKKSTTIPSVYIFSKETPNVDKVLATLDAHKIEYSSVGSSYVVYTNQFHRNIICTLFEPGSSFKASFQEKGYISSYNVIRQ